MKKINALLRFTALEQSRLLLHKRKQEELLSSLRETLSVEEKRLHQAYSKSYTHAPEQELLRWQFINLIKNQLRTLLKQIQQLKLEHEQLKKASLYHAQQIKALEKGMQKHRKSQQKNLQLIAQSAFADWFFSGSTNHE